MDSISPLLTRPQLAEYLRVSAGYLAHAAIRGEGPPYLRVGARAVRYDLVAVRAWLADQTKAAA